MAVEPASAAKENLLRLLVEAGTIDTAYRDIYLHHALGLIQDIFPRTEFLKLKEYGRQADELVRRSRLAAERNDWDSVREYAARISFLRSTIAEHEHVFSVAADIYEPADVVVDPFSPGLRGYIATRGANPPELHRRIIEIFAALETGDAESRVFYTRREDRFRSLAISSGDEPREEKRRVDPARLQRDALLAVEKGDVENLDRLLRQMQSTGMAVAASDAPQRRPADDGHLVEPFPPQAVAAARLLGMGEAEVGAAPRVSDFLWEMAWQPHLPEQQPSREGHIRLSRLEQDIPGGIPDPLRETLEMFMLHPFVNSAGVRYLPALAAERVLVEDFPEDDIPGAEGVAGLLGFSARTAIARVTLETALLQKGPEVLKGRFGLDPCGYRLVCIPFDIYARLAAAKNWGTQPRWTHFDGYQLVRGGGVRALVGGDVRYGGRFDLCSISDFDEREGVVARFAVVRRERMLAAA